MKTPSVTLLKLGGAVITDKQIPNTLRPGILENLTQILSSHWKEQGDSSLIVGHGAGSFAHVPASQYKTIDGFQNSQSRIGMAITQDSAAQLNRIVVSEFLKHGVPAVTVAPSNSLVTKNRSAQHAFSEVFREYLRQGLLPVTYGDVIVDSQQGCTIWSTDTILAFFAGEFLKKHWSVKRIIHVTQVPAVYKNLENPAEGYFETITSENAQEVKKAMGVTAGFDVTGGMWLKIEESLRLAEHGVETVVLSGLTAEPLQACLRGEPFVGTKIC